MNKKTEYALKGAGIGGLGGIVINTIVQLIEMNKNPQKEFDFNDMFKTGLKGAAIGAGAGLAVGAIKDHFNELEAPINTNAFILSVVDEIKLKKGDSDYVKLSKRADAIEQVINNSFKEKISGVSMRGGSTENGTALKENFDIDIYFPFKSDSFSSTEEMYESLFNFLENSSFNNGFKSIRRQGKSIGVLFIINGKEYKIDVVPYKVSPNSVKNNTGYLYVNKDSIFKKNSYTKTDIKKLKSIKLTPTQQKIYVLLKDWKRQNNLPLKSYLLQKLILKAYNANRNRIPRDISKKVIMVIEFISENIINIKVNGSENTNNILTNIPLMDKQLIKDVCKKVLKDYDYQPNSLVQTFG